MNQELPIIEVDYDVVHRLDEQKCNTCKRRFECWTSRKGLFLDVRNFTISHTIDWAHKDAFEIEAVIPDCIELDKNLVGAKIKISRGQVLAIGIILSQDIHLEVNQPMKIILKGNCSPFY